MKKRKSRSKPTMKQLIKKLDELTSLIVRKREPYCVTCGSTSDLTNSHLITRRVKNLRWNLDNCHTQCRSCNFKHNYYPEIYTEWWLNKYSLEEYNKLLNLAKQTKKYSLSELEEMINHYKKILQTY